MTSLVLGPLLRHVGPTTASVWVETDAPTRVEVRCGDGAGGHASTFRVGDQHYALVVLRDLAPAATRTYEVHLDDARVWPLDGAGTPPSRIRTRSAPGDDGGDRLRIVFGSCRYPPTDDPELEASLGVDALDAYATRLMAQLHDDGDPEALLPDALCLLGDQVYADETTPRTQAWMRARGKADDDGAGPKITEYAEYAHLYHETWLDRELRWLLSTVPTSMIFDDHDVHDDWNTSLAWRRQMQATSWWPGRIRAGLASYWVYQHIGNLDPAELEADEVYRKVTTAGPDVDVLDDLGEFAARADAEVGEPEGVRWSYRWDLGRTRLLMVDSRCGRVLNDRERLMINTHSFAWLEEQSLVDHDDVDHLLFGSSIPWLMPPTISTLQSVDEVAAARGPFAEQAEKIRQAVDLEHWPSFRASFDRLARMIERVAASSTAPATVCVLSGDVHHSYAAQARFTTPTRSRVFQLTCSPVRNGVPWFMEYVFAAGWRRGLHRVVGAVARRFGVEPEPLTWSAVGGPYFGNAVATLEITGRRARVRFERSGRTGGLESAAELPLA